MHATPFASTHVRQHACVPRDASWEVTAGNITQRSTPESEDNCSLPHDTCMHVKCCMMPSSLHTCSSAMPQPIRVTPSTNEGLAKSTLTMASGKTLRCTLLKRRKRKHGCRYGKLLLLLLLRGARGMVLASTANEAAEHADTALRCSCLEFKLRSCVVLRIAKLWGNVCGCQKGRQQQCSSSQQCVDSCCLLVAADADAGLAHSLPESRNNLLAAPAQLDKFEATCRYYTAVSWAPAQCPVTLRAMLMIYHKIVVSLLIFE